MMRWGTGQGQWFALIGIWFLVGAATSAILTPSSRLLQRNSTWQSRPGIFAAQFSLSHACFLLTYPLAGMLGAVFGLPAAATVLVAIGAFSAVLAFATWRTPPRMDHGSPAATRPATRKGR